MLSCIIEKNQVYLAIDTPDFNIVGVTKTDKHKLENVPIFHVESKNEIIIATDSLRFGDILRYIDIYDIDFTFESLVKNVIPKYRQIALKYALVEEKGRLPGNLIITNNEKAFYIDTYGLLFTINKSIAVEDATRVSFYIFDEYENETIESKLKRLYTQYKDYFGIHSLDVLIYSEKNGLTETIIL